MLPGAGGAQVKHVVAPVVLLRAQPISTICMLPRQLLDSELPAS